MAILVDEGTKLCVSGITGREGTFHAMNNRRYGTQVVSGVTPGKGGQDVEGVPVFNTFHDAVAETGANTAMIFVPPRFAADSILEAEDAGIALVIAITEGIPAHDELRVYNHLLAQPGLPPGRPQLPRHPLARQGQRRDHPRLVLQGGQRRRRLALGHADLPDRQRAGPERLRQLEHRRHRRRPGPGLELHRHHRAVRGRRRDRADRDGGRDRRLGRGGGRRLHRRERLASRSSPTSPASPRRPARRWATPARSSRAPRARRRRRPRRSRPRACGSAAPRPRSPRSPPRSPARSRAEPRLSTRPARVGRADDPRPHAASRRRWPRRCRRARPRGRATSTAASPAARAALLGRAGAHLSGAALALQGDGRATVAGQRRARLPGRALRRARRARPLLRPPRPADASASRRDARGGARAVALFRDGRILVAGTVTLGGVRRFAVARLQPGGNLDANFGAGGVAVVGPPRARSSRRWRCSPRASSCSPARCRPAPRRAVLVMRLLADGTPDPAFGARRRRRLDRASSSRAARATCSCCPTGGSRWRRRSSAARAARATFLAARLTPAGAFDPTFGGDGVARVATTTRRLRGGGAAALALGRRGRLILAGTARGARRARRRDRRAADARRARRTRASAALASTPATPRALAADRRDAPRRARAARARRPRRGPRRRRPAAARERPPRPLVRRRRAVRAGRAAAHPARRARAAPRRRRGPHRQRAPGIDRPRAQPRGRTPARVADAVSSGHGRHDLLRPRAPRPSTSSTGGPQGGRAARVHERPGGHVRLRHLGRLRPAARVDRRAARRRGRPGAGHQRLDAGRRVPVPAARRPRRRGDRRVADLRPHAAEPAQPRRRRADGRARDRRDRRRRASSRCSSTPTSAPSSRTSSPTSRTPPATR